MVKASTLDFTPLVQAGLEVDTSTEKASQLVASRILFNQGYLVVVGWHPLDVKRIKNYEKRPFYAEVIQSPTPTCDYFKLLNHYPSSQKKGYATSPAQLCKDKLYLGAPKGTIAEFDLLTGVKTRIFNSKMQAAPPTFSLFSVTQEYLCSTFDQSPAFTKTGVVRQSMVTVFQRAKHSSSILAQLLVDGRLTSMYFERTTLYCTCTKNDSEVHLVGYDLSHPAPGNTFLIEEMTDKIPGPIVTTEEMFLVGSQEGVTALSKMGHWQEQLGTEGPISSLDVIDDVAFILPVHEDGLTMMRLDTGEVLMQTPQDPPQEAIISAQADANSLAVLLGDHHTVLVYEFK